MAIAGKIMLKGNLRSEKDYVALPDVIAIIPRILLDGKEDIYNIAFGANASHAAITRELRRLTGCDLVAAADGAEVSFPVIAIDRVREEFGWRPRELLADLPELLSDYKRWQGLRVPLTSS
jgi:nucleoside-diphosphate-sugar epimerase